MYCRSHNGATLTEASERKGIFQHFLRLLVGKNVFASVVDNSLKLFGFIILLTKILRMVKMLVRCIF